MSPNSIDIASSLVGNEAILFNWSAVSNPSPMESPFTSKDSYSLAKS